MNKFELEVKGNFGFGCMRLPMIGENVDEEQFKKMVDIFIESGFNYFDTAHGYIDGKSELALKNCLTGRYSRDKFVLANKLSDPFFNKEEEILPLFNSQLKACGVDYFDFYLMHAQNSVSYEKYVKLRAYDIARELKKQGKIKHFGLSFHDTPEVLDKILTEQKDVEFVQIQFNYLDYLDPFVQSKRLYETCVKHGKPVIVMEPVKGGNLVNLSNDVKKVFEELNGGSPASYAVRFASSFDNMFMTLSGMSTIEQVLDNVSFMKDFKKINEEELKAINKAVELINSQDLIGCTGCSYCTSNCPKHLKIPNLFAVYNDVKRFPNLDASWFYNSITENGRKPSDCLKCGNCERACPQKLKVRDLLIKVSNEFEK